MSNYCKINGKKGGRPKCSQYNSFELPDFQFIVLTPSQYETLLEKYGYSILNKAFSIFEKWLTTSREGGKYKGKNNYAHFRSDGWVINTAIQSVAQNNN